MNKTKQPDNNEPVLATAVKDGLFERIKKSGFFQQLVSTPWMLATAIAGSVVVLGTTLVIFMAAVGMMFAGGSGSSAHFDDGGFTQWDNGGFSDGRGGYRSRSGMSHGTFDKTGGGNNVISFDGEVLPTPPY